MKKTEETELSSEDRDSLTRRYLFWLYKTVRDECDRVDRKFTQLDIDAEIAEFFDKAVSSCQADQRRGVAPFVEEWASYIAGKKRDAQVLKFMENGDLNPQYQFSRLKLKAVEQAVVSHFGRGRLKEFKRMYEQAALQGILQDNSGRR